MKRRSILGVSALVAAIGLAVPAEGTLRTPFLDMLVKQSSGSARQSLMAFKTLLGHKHKVLAGILQVRSTGLRQLVCRMLQNDLRHLLIIMARKKRNPADTLAMLRRNLLSWAKRLRPAVVDALESYGKPPGLTDFFNLMREGDQTAWKLVAQVFKGELKQKAKAVTDHWTRLRPKLEEALGRFRTWATTKGLDGIRTALYQANLILQENKPSIVPVGAATTVAKAPAKATREPVTATQAPAKATQAPAKATQAPAKATQAPAKATQAPAKAPAKEAKEPAKQEAPPKPPEATPDAPTDLGPMPGPVPVPNT